MAEHNNLTASQEELLLKLIEESSEVIKEACKTLHYGYESCNPFDPTRETNRDKIEKEIGDLMNIVELIQGQNDLSSENIRIRKESKKQEIYKWLLHQDKENE